MYAYLGLLQRIEANPRRYNGKSDLYRSLSQFYLGEFIRNGEILYDRHAAAEKETQPDKEVVVFSDSETMLN
jgi:hypothetical protein